MNTKRARIATGGKNIGSLLAASFAVVAAQFAQADAKVWFDELPLEDMACGWGKPKTGKSVDGNPLRIGSKTFAMGVGTHAKSAAIYMVSGNAVAFDADVGIDAEVFSDPSRPASLKFIVKADGRAVAETDVLKGKTESVHLHADLAGAQLVELEVCDAGDGNSYDHADWANAYFTMKDGTRPTKVVTEQLGILTPPPSPSPRINGARVFGVRPGHPILWRVPVTGERPMRFSASGLPAGARFDAKTGFISGSVAERGEYKIEFSASNAKGSARRELKLVVGDTIALTPPMGWNSWNCFAADVTEKNIRDAADAFVSAGLADHGWSYINIDDFWQNSPYAGKRDPTLAGPERNADGTIAVNKRFSDMKALADYIHSLGLRAGIYSSPGPYTCGACVGSWGHEWQDAKTYADWGFDYLKYDWCSYGGVADKVASGHGKHSFPYMLMGEALAAQNRDIVFSLCQYGNDNVSTWGKRIGGHCWRTTGDIEDTWGDSTKLILDKQKDLWPYAGPGGWNDPDMLVVGVVGKSGSLKPTRLTRNEQYTHVSIWSILCSPLLIGCDMTKLDDFTLSLLTNDEVIETNQDELGAQAAVVAEGPRAQVWAKPMSDGSLVFALFNTYLLDTRITIDFASLGLEGRWLVRDLWRQKDLGVYSVQYAADVPGHATQLVRLFPREDGRLADGVRDIRMNAVYRRFESVRPVDKPGYRAQKGYPCADCPKNRAR